MKYWIIFLFGGAGLTAVGVLIWLSGQEPTAPPVELPPAATFAVIQMTPSITPSVLTASITPSPMPSPTLATRIAVATIIMPDVTLLPSTTPLPENLQILAEAPDPIEPLPEATLLPFPYTDFTAWVSFESDHPAVQYVKGSWMPIGSLQASQGQYHFTEDTDAVVRFAFNGEAVRIRYVGFTNGGIWQVVIDGAVVDTIDGYAPIGMFTGTQVYTLSPGDHLLELHNTTDHNPASSGHMLALDAVQVYRLDALSLIVPGGVLPSSTPTPTLIPAEKIEVIAAPPPTATTIPLQNVSASLVIGYDENANGVLDVNEGVRGISVRLVESGTNQMLAHGLTDEQGYIQLQALSHTAVQMIVPYFAEAWAISARTGGTFTLLLSPGNQPGLIP